MDAEHLTFANGMSLWLVNQPGRDVSIDLWLPYGRINESPQAHFLEHMAFKSNEHRTVDKIGHDSEGRGIEYNAWIDDDCMNFHMLAPSEHALLAVELLYQSFTNEQFSQQEIELEKGVLKAELLLAKSDPTYEMLNNRMRHALFEGHPLLLEDETEEAIDALGLQDLIASKRNFGPKNLSLAVVGNLNGGEITESIYQTFGQLKSGGLEKATLPMPERHHCLETEYRDKVESGSVFIAFTVAGLEHQDKPSLDFLSHAMGRDGYIFSGRLWQEIRTKRGMAYRLGSDYTRYNGVGVFFLGVEGIQRNHVAEVGKIMIEQLERLSSEEMSEDEFARIKTNLGVMHYRKNFGSIERLSQWISLSELSGTPWPYEAFEMQQASLTPDIIKEAATRYFDGKYFVGEIIPKN